MVLNQIVPNSMTGQHSGIFVNRQLTGITYVKIKTWPLTRLGQGRSSVAELCAGAVETPRTTTKLSVSARISSSRSASSAVCLSCGGKGYVADREKTVKKSVVEPVRNRFFEKI